MNQALAKQHTFTTGQFDNLGSNTLQIVGRLIQKHSTFALFVNRRYS
ncbi:MAG: hypothetical protein JSU95_00045 [Betaproteobacteria bacterium]|nr:MAG: hypothetical protein JSU95_00045 [Betaproteobacteria bacterium]